MSRGGLEPPGPPVAVRITAEHHVGHAQGVARSMAHALGLSDAAVYSVATAVSELASNLVFQARGGGTLRLRPLRREGRVGVEVVAEDEGPGIPDLGRALRDGFTTNRGLGGGLPGVRRLMEEFEITSAEGRGTRVVARKWESCR